MTTPSTLAPTTPSTRPYHPSARRRAAGAGLIALAMLAGAGTGAFAGPCSERIATLEKQLSARDAGSGPTNAAPAATTPPADTVPKAGEASGTGGTPAMNETLGQRAASPADVRAQTSGTPTAAQGAASSAGDLDTAMTRARQADSAGDSGACTKALDEAEALMRG